MSENPETKYTKWSSSSADVMHVMCDFDKSRDRWQRRAAGTGPANFQFNAA